MKVTVLVVCLVAGVLNAGTVFAQINIDMQCKIEILGGKI